MSYNCPPLSPTIVLKRKTKMLYVPLVFENGLMADALVDSRAYVRVVSEIELNRVIEHSLISTFKIDDPPHFQLQMANGKLEKSLATATLKFNLGD